MSDAQIARLSAKGFAENYLEELSTEVLAWRKRAKLPVDCKMDQLAKICVRYCSQDDEYLEAERLVIVAALSAQQAVYNRTQKRLSRRSHEQ